mgnify:CR=1 FL=1
MSDEEREGLEVELADLTRKLAARANKPGLEQNIIAIRARIAEIEQELAN